MSYDSTDLSDLNTARALLGDTSNDAATELLTDAAITAALTLYTYNAGVAFLASGLAARYAQNPDRVTLPSGLSVAWSERVKYWLSLVERMLNGGGITGSTAFSRTPRRVDGYSEAAAVEQGL